MAREALHRHKRILPRNMKQRLRAHTNHSNMSIIWWRSIVKMWYHVKWAAAYLLWLFLRAKTDNHFLERVVSTCIVIAICRNSRGFLNNHPSLARYSGLQLGYYIFNIALDKMYPPLFRDLSEIMNDKHTLTSAGFFLDLFNGIFAKHWFMTCNENFLE